MRLTWLDAAGGAGEVCQSSPGLLAGLNVDTAPCWTRAKLH